MYPFASWSTTLIPVASLGPLFVTSTLNVISSPTLGVSSLTVFTTDKSAAAKPKLLEQETFSHPVKLKSSYVSVVVSTYPSGSGSTIFTL